MVYTHGGDTRIVWSSTTSHGLVLTPRFAYALDEHRWETSKELQEKIGAIAEVCYSKGEQVFWAGRYRFHNLKDKNPHGYRGDGTQAVSN
jgi:hypothetical protein